MKASGPLAIVACSYSEVDGLLRHYKFDFSSLQPTTFLQIFNDSPEEDLILSLVLFQELLGLRQKL